MSSKLDSLRKRIGDRIRQIHIELDLDQGNIDSPNLVVAYLEFDVGNPFVLGCAGDGGVSIRKVKPDVLSDASGIIEPFSGATLLEVSKHQNFLVLSTDKGKIGFQNDGDQLFVSIPASWDSIQ